MSVIDQECKVILQDADGNKAEISEGRLKSDTQVSLASTLATQFYGWDESGEIWRKISAAEYPVNSGTYWIGVFGEVGTRTKAENPINLSVRKTLASKDLTVFADKTVPANTVWYILSATVADQLGAEFHVWQGYGRDVVESFNGNGSNKEFTLTKATLNNSDYISVTVGGVGKTLGTDYELEVADDGETAKVIFDSAPASGTDNVVVTYDSMMRRCAAMVQSSSTQPYTFEAPVKLTAGQFIIGTVSNNSANAGTVILNLSGFYEDA